jgi:excinuclease ABC subunit B
MFADTVTASMQAALDETERRRAKQKAFNEAHGITPRTIEKRIGDLRALAGFRTELSVHEEETTVQIDGEVIEKEAIPGLVAELKKKMTAAAKELDFEGAAEHRDRIRALEAAQLGVSEAVAFSSNSRRTRRGSSERRRGTGRRSVRP